MSWTIKAAQNQVKFAISGQFTIDITLADVEKTPEIEKLKSANMDPQEKATKAQEISFDILQNAAYNKISALRDYAVSQGIWLQAQPPSEIKEGEINWNDYFARTGGTTPAIGEQNNESPQAQTADQAPNQQ